MTTAATSESNTNQPWTVKRLLQWTSTYLANAGVEHGRLCAEILLADILQRERIALYTHFDYCPNPDELAGFRAIVKRCGQHEPVQYLTGIAHFYNLTIKVNPSVLIPRPETELLVEQAIAFANEILDRDEVRILDLCTGSGCIAAAIAANTPESLIVATDASDAALQTAAANLNDLGLSERITLLKSDLFGQIPAQHQHSFDLVVSNPPYISKAEFDKLDKNVRQYEPLIALQGGQDGLDFYRRIVQDARPWLAPNGSIIVEVGYNQAEAVESLFTQSGYLKQVRLVRDSLGHNRLVKGIFETK